MENNLKFNSQICTTKIQSERLLALGLKRETADMCIDNIGTIYTYPITIIEAIKKDWGLIPLWSLHRLIEIADNFGISMMFDLNVENWYDDIIAHIQSCIHLGFINEDYLNMDIVNAKENENIELLKNVANSYVEDN